MLPSEAHVFAVYLPCFSSTIGLVNVLCKIEAYVRTGLCYGDFTEYLARARTDRARHETRARKYAHVLYC